MIQPGCSRQATGDATSLLILSRQVLLGPEICPARWTMAPLGRNPVCTAFLPFGIPASRAIKAIVVLELIASPLCTDRLILKIRRLLLEKPILLFKRGNPLLEVRCLEFDIRQLGRQVRDKIIDLGFFEVL